jgi:excisionase family DNA binding protein
MPRAYVRPVPVVAMSPNKAAAATGLRLEKISAAVREGWLHTHRVGTKTLILTSDLEAWIKSHPSALRGARHARD